jgi:hypothetical protein
VLVRFVDERFEGRQEWVPPARLKVPWAAVGVFREREARWDRIDKLGIGDEPVSRAAEEVFEALIEHDIARIEYREAGVAMSLLASPSLTRRTTSRSAGVSAPQMRVVTSGSG